MFSLRGPRASCCCMPHETWPHVGKRKGPGAVRAMQLGSIKSSIGKTLSRNVFQIRVSLQVGSQVIHTYALLDSGATTCFMDELFAHTHSIPRVAQAKPIPVEVIDGRPLVSGAITEGTTPLQLMVGSHSEVITFCLISSPRHPIILGLSWLETHNPMVD